ncbi:hypothetical protein ACFYNO_33295 [Kitasatospora sp. NPDC006697]|uniref:hypothetical protein n=1 Tax=Kitasatospora sp. NPDC006697 TaxID=3364020 RepID=UPI0036A3AC5B
MPASRPRRRRRRPRREVADALFGRLARPLVYGIDRRQAGRYLRVVHLVRPAVRGGG